MKDVTIVLVVNNCNVIDYTIIDAEDINKISKIQWEECSCLRGIRLEDVTVELEEEAYEEMRNNK